MKRDWEMLLAAAPNGLYAAPGVIGPARLAARRLGWRWFDLDLAGVRDKAGFLARCAGRLSLPGYFGANWDALAECLADPAWLGAPGAVVWWHGGAEFARTAAVDAENALDICAEAARTWRGDARAFLVLVEHGASAGVAPPHLD
jgi:hypothetical protein